MRGPQSDASQRAIKLNPGVDGVMRWTARRTAKASRASGTTYKVRRLPRSRKDDVPTAGAVMLRLLPDQQRNLQGRLVSRKRYQLIVHIHFSVAVNVEIVSVSIGAARA
jgi:hypothetical protein